jgi:hypothetical protein
MMILGASVVLAISAGVLARSTASPVRPQQTDRVHERAFA